MTKLEIQLGNEMFKFTSEQHWINSAQSYFSKIDHNEKYIAVDSIGRVCVKGLEFIRATKENTYPITVYKMLC